MPNEQNDGTTTLVQVAHMYYDENLSQQEIADRLGVSRSLIALYLNKARQQGIVRIEVIDPRDSGTQLAMSLCEAYDLAHASVVPVAHNLPELSQRAIAGAAASYMESQLEDGDILGLAWGRTISDVVSLLAPSKPCQIEVVPLLGESSHISNYTQMNQLTLQAAKSFNAHPHFLLAPMLVGSVGLRDALMQDPVVSQVAEHWNHLKIACVGVGVVPPLDGMVVYIGDEHIPRLQEQGAVGDVCARYFDADGTLIDTELHDRMIGISLEQLYTAHDVMAVASGVQKTRAVRGALRTGLITALFVDKALAEALLASDD